MTVRRMTKGELVLALDWAAAEGWNPGLEDAEAFYAADPDGFFLSEVDDSPAAVISVVNHNPGLAFLGLYICKPEHRGNGIGFDLWRKAITHAGDRTIGLDGVPDQQANYARSGFVPAGETRRFEGVIAGTLDPDMRLAEPADIPTLTEREAQAMGFAKPAFNARWFLPCDTRRTHILGTALATVRDCRHGRKIGPLVAERLEDAVRMIRHIAAQGSGKLVIDVPEGNDVLADWCAAEGMIVSFGTARMYRSTPPTPGPGVIAASTLELG